MSADAELESGLRALEERLLDPAVRTSPDALDPLLADDFVEIGRSGRVYDKAALVAALGEEPGSRPALRDFRLRRLAQDVALCTYRTPGALRSSLWVRREGRWQLAFHQGTATSAPA